MTKPVTIDNLGIDPSRRYAQDVAETDKDFFKDSGRVSNQISVTATSPYISDFEELFGTLIRAPSWANFSPPPDFASHAKNLFTYQIVPSLGTPEELDHEIQVLEDVIEGEGKGKQEGGQEGSEEEQEKQKIVSMLQCVQRFDKILELINARKGEFHKG